MAPLPDFDSPVLLGALEIGAFVSIFLFGAVVMQGHLYFKNSKDDSRLLTLFVSLILLLELGHAIAAAHTVWWATITVASLPVKPGNAYPIAACTLYEALITTLVKAYYINRVRQLSSKTWPALIGWSLTAIEAAASLALSYECFRDVPREPNNFEYQRNWGWLITSCLVLGAVIDMLIAATMVYLLRRVTAPLQASAMKNTAEILNSILIWTIETGMLTSIASMTVLTCFQLMKFNYIWVAVYLPLAKLYSNSLIASLNARPSRRRKLGLVQTQQQESTESMTRIVRFDSPSSAVSVASREHPPSKGSGKRRSTYHATTPTQTEAASTATGVRRSTVSSVSSVVKYYEEPRSPPPKPQTQKHYTHATRKINASSSPYIQAIPMQELNVNGQNWKRTREQYAARTSSRLRSSTAMSPFTPIRESNENTPFDMPRVGVAF